MRLNLAGPRLLIATLVPFFIACSKGEKAPAATAHEPGAAAKAPPKQPDSEIAKLVPAGTAIYVQVPSIDRLSDAIRAVHKAFDPETDTADVERALEDIDLPGSLQEIDRSKPLALCGVLPEKPNGGEPVPMYIVPTKSPEKFIESVKSDKNQMLQLTTVVQGSYVLVSTKGDLKVGPEAPPIALGLPAGDIVVRLDVPRLVQHFRPMIEMSLGQLTAVAEQMSAQATGGMDVAPLMKMYADGILAVLDSGEKLDFALRMNGSVVEIASELVVREKSALDGYASKEKTAAKSLGRFADPSAAMSMVIGMDQKMLLQKMKPMLDAVFAMYPEPMGSSFKKLMGSADQLVDQLGTAMCVNGSFGADGLRYAVYVQPKDPKKLAETYRTMLSSVTGITLDDFKEGEVEGVHALRSRVHVDVEALAGPAAGAAAGPQAEQMKAMLQRMYGKDGLAFTMATQGDVTAVVVGGDDAFLSKSVAQLKSPGQPPASMARGLAEVGDLNPCFALQYDLGATMKGMQELMGRDMAGMPPGLASSMAATLRFHGGVDGRSWRGSMVADVAEIGASFRKMSEGLHAPEAGAPTEPK